MSNDVRLAFAHPSERADAMAGGEPLDRISLRDHIVEVEIGAFQAERGVTQRGPGALGVEIVRGRDGGPVADVAQEDAVQPEIVFLGNDAIVADHLTGWLDQLEDLGRPLILCVGAADVPAPQVPHPMAQRRIDLLAIEQNAWVLAARDDRCVVVNTRTELDWAMKNGQTCVWAPSKIVLDAVESPSAQPRDAVALAAWFAATFEAKEMLVVGAELPKGTSVPLRAIPADQVVL
jgi:dihydroneopterin aldolase